MFGLGRIHLEIGDRVGAMSFGGIGVLRHLVTKLGLAMWNAMNSLVTGSVVFSVGYGVGWSAGRKDPKMLGVLRAGTRYPARFDPGKWANEPGDLMIR